MIHPAKASAKLTFKRFPANSSIAWKYVEAVGEPAVQVKRHGMSVDGAYSRLFKRNRVFAKLLKEAFRKPSVFEEGSVALTPGGRASAA